MILNSASKKAMIISGSCNLFSVSKVHITISNQKF